MQMIWRTCHPFRLPIYWYDCVQTLAWLSSLIRICSFSLKVPFVIICQVLHNHSATVPCAILKIARFLPVCDGCKTKPSCRTSKRRVFSMDWNNNKHSFCAQLKDPSLSRAAKTVPSPESSNLFRNEPEPLVHNTDGDRRQSFRCYSSTMHYVGSIRKGHPECYALLLLLFLRSCTE